jgi:ATP-dependent Lhr-like helicase
VLVQHAVTVALGQGFQEEELFREVRTTGTYAKLEPQEWQWVLDFATTGGHTLQAYPEYQRVNVQEGVYRLTEKKTAQRHRLSIGTIMSDTAVTVRYLRGSRLGTVEESFISRLHPGDVFIFAGKSLELVRYKDNTAFVRRAAGKRGAVPVWYGGRMPLSTELCHFVRARLNQAAGGDFSGTEMAFINPLLTLQALWSRLPASDELLIESIVSREGHHLFIYPFEGRLVHEGLAALLALRLSRLAALTFTWAVNDYGFELLSSKPVPLEMALTNGLLSTEGLLNDIQESINLAELAKNQFREVARVAGLVFAGYPGRNKTLRQVQVTSNLLYSVFEKYDPENLLLSQARKEVLERQLEANRLQQSLRRLSQAKLIVTNPEHFTPLAFPLMTDRLRHQLSSEKFLDRVERLVNRLERAARKEKGKRLA